jgi:hypothetical protein
MCQPTIILQYGQRPNSYEQQITTIPPHATPTITMACPARARRGPCVRQRSPPTATGHHLPKLYYPAVAIDPFHRPPPRRCRAPSSSVAARNVAVIDVAAFDDAAFDCRLLHGAPGHPSLLRGRRGGRQRRRMGDECESNTTTMAGRSETTGGSAATRR